MAIQNLADTVIQDLAKTDDDPKLKIAIMQIYAYNHSNDFFSRTTGPICLIFCMKHMGLLPIYTI